MFKHLPILITILVAAMLFGLVGHGFELFFPIEGENWYGAIKAFGFPLAIECSSSVGLYVGFSRITRGKLTRLVALGIGLFSLITSFIVQFHYFRGRIEYDGWYSAVLPGLVALLSALAGLLDREQASNPAHGQAHLWQEYVRKLEEELSQERETFAAEKAGSTPAFEKQKDTQAKEAKPSYLTETPELGQNNARGEGKETKVFQNDLSPEKGDETDSEKVLSFQPKGNLYSSGETSRRTSTEPEFNTAFSPVHMTGSERKTGAGNKNTSPSKVKRFPIDPLTVAASENSPELDLNLRSSLPTSPRNRTEIEAGTETRTFAEAPGNGHFAENSGKSNKAGSSIQFTETSGRSSKLITNPSFAETPGETPAVLSIRPGETNLTTLLETKSAGLKANDPRRKWLEAVRLNRLEGRNYKEIGAKLGISDRSASNWCQWGQQVLEGKR